MKKAAIVTACLLLATPALAQSLGEKSGVNSVLGISPTTPDFVKQVAISDMFEVESSKLAAAKAEGPTKEFANRMISEHTKTSAELKAAVASDPKTPIPTALDDAHKAKLDELKALSGADFAKRYHAMQEEAHEDAVSLFKRYAEGGDSDKLKRWAAETLPALQHHLDMAKALNKQRSARN
jgi:putative membrane protein